MNILRKKVIDLLKKNIKIYTYIRKKYLSILFLIRKNDLLSKFYDFLYNRIQIELKNDSVFSYCQKNRLIVDVLEENKKRPVLSPKEYPRNKNSEVLFFETPRIYYSVLKNVKIWGDNDAISCEDFLLDDRYMYEYKNEIQFETNICRKYNDDITMLSIPKKEEIIDEGIFMIGQASNNWYHWTFDVLSRIAYINRYNKLKSVPLIVDDAIREHDTYKQLLKYVDNCSHKILYINKNTTYFVQKLHYFSRNTWSAVYNIGEKYSMSFVRYAKPYTPIEFYRKHVLTKCKRVGEKRYKNIFVKRPSNVYARLINEEELAKTAEKYGFIIYEPSKTDVLQQATVFNEAENIIAGEGAALVNLIWCNRNTNVACIICEDWHDYNFSTIAYLCGLNCTYLVTKEFKDQRHIFPLEHFETYLKLQGFKKE